MSEDMSVQIKELFEVILQLKSVDDCQDFFNDLCTYNELDSMAQRLQAAKLLKNNETYEQIIAKTGISSATLSRVSRCLKHGAGYNKFVK